MPRRRRQCLTSLFLRDRSTQLTTQLPTATAFLHLLVTLACHLNRIVFCSRRPDMAVHLRGRRLAQRFCAVSKSDGCQWFSLFIDCRHCLHSVRSRVYVRVGCPSVRLFVPSFGSRTPLRRVCCCGPGEQEISIDCCAAGAQQQIRAVSHYQLTCEAEHRLVYLAVC